MSKVDQARALVAGALALKKKAQDEAAALAEAEQVIARHEADEAEAARAAAETKLRAEYLEAVASYNQHRDEALDYLARYAGSAREGMALLGNVAELRRQLGLLLPGGQNDPTLPELPISAVQVIASERGTDANRFHGLAV